MSDNDSNIRAFEVDLQAFAKKLDLAPKIVVIRITLDLFRRITKRTPVDTGRLRNSWQIEGGIVTRANPLAEGQYGPEAPPQLSRDRTIVGRSWTIHNPLPYARRIEYGHSQAQAPSGMVRVTLAEFDGIIRRAGVTFMSEARL